MCILSRSLKQDYSRKKIFSTVGMMGPSSLGEDFQIIIIDARKQILNQNFSIAKPQLNLNSVTSLLMKNDMTKASVFALSPNGKFLFSGAHFDNCVKVSYFFMKNHVLIVLIVSF